MKETSTADGGERARYVAFLRGVNVGGHGAVKMEDLRQVFQSLGFTECRTVLASGNVLFASRPTDPGRLEKKISQALGGSVMVRPVSDLRKLAASSPFEKIPVTPQTRFSVTFKTRDARSDLAIPYESPEKDFWIVRVTPGEILSALVLSPGRGTSEAMAFLEREFGSQITTRNWNTVERILNA